MEEKGGAGLGQPGSARIERGKAHPDGDVHVQMTVAIAMGVISLVLTLGGLLAFFYNAQNAKDLWVIIGPIISAALSGFVAFLIGKRSGAATKQRLP
jgi:hypothetical protein